MSAQRLSIFLVACGPVSEMICAVVGQTEARMQ